MKLAEVMAELKRLGSEQTRKTFARHGAPQGMFGVKVADLKVVAKKIKGDQALAMKLYKTANPDAQYLAGIVADGGKMSRKELDAWAKTATWQMVAEYTVPWVAAESPHARACALAWMKSTNPSIASAGWNTYAGYLATRPDQDLSLPEIVGLLKQVAEKIHEAPDRVRYCMNGFVIGVGTYVKPLLAKAKATAKKIGHVEVDMGRTSCKVPAALDYIEKVEAMQRVGKKRATAKC